MQIKLIVVVVIVVISNARSVGHRQQMSRPVLIATSLTTRAIPYSSPGKGVGGSVVRKGWVHKSDIRRANQVGSPAGQMVSEIQD